MKYAKFNFGDWLADTVTLTSQQEGLYLRLVTQYYITEQPIPLAHHICCQMARALTKKEQNDVVFIMKKYFIATEHGWIHKRCDAEIEKTGQTRASRSYAATKRWDKEKE